MHPECPPPTPPESPAASVVNLLTALTMAPTCPNTCNCSKVSEPAAPQVDTDASTLQAEPSDMAPAIDAHDCPCGDEAALQTLDPEAQHSASPVSNSDGVVLHLHPASIENKASCSRAVENCCKTSEVAPCNAAKLERMSLTPAPVKAVVLTVLPPSELHFEKKATEAPVTCCGQHTPAAACGVTASNGEKVPGCMSGVKAAPLASPSV